MEETLLILEQDKEAARMRVKEIEDAIQALGPEFNEVFAQSSETWHDNAPFDALRDRQSVLAAELQNLRTVLRSCAIRIPKQKKGVVGIGSTVTARDIDSGKTTSYFIAGDWTINPGTKQNGSLKISRKSPIAEKLIGKKVGDTITFKHSFVIESLS